VIGVTLIVIGATVPGIQGTPWGQYFIMSGIALTVGGVMQLISPQPTLNAGNEDSVRSKYLPSSQNTVRIGTTIPLLYGGPVRCGGHIMSLNIDAKDSGL
jgi:predicted phage tail protein